MKTSKMLEKINVIILYDLKESKKNVRIHKRGGNMLFSNYQIKDYIFKNRIVMAPMCTYQATSLAFVNDFHIIHYGARAISGLGAIIVEATGVEARGRITENDLGIYSDKHIPGLKRLSTNIKKYGTIAGIQLAHAGRKSKTSKTIIAPSAINFPNLKQPREMTKKDINDVIEAFKQAAIRANKTGFDLIEVHAAHGYLINQFLSPLTNKRDDEYGGSINNRMKFLVEVLEAVTSVWPKDKLLGLRISATEYSSEGNGVKELSYIINKLKDFNLDFLDVSTGGVIPADINAYPGYQIPLAKEIKETTKIPTIAGGLITTAKEADNILKENNLDFIYFGRELLRNPNFTYYAAKELNVDYEVFSSYVRAK